ncbi:MAG: hypothetical protein QX193_00850 [Methylococcales bacterium]|nr:hypothetical protein [Methylococcales bacterium]
MLEIQAVTPSYRVFKVKKIHQDEYRTPNKPHRNNLKSEEKEDEQDESTPRLHIDELA